MATSITQGAKDARGHEMSNRKGLIRNAGGQLRGPGSSSVNDEQRAHGLIDRWCPAKQIIDTLTVKSVSRTSRKSLATAPMYAR